MEVLYTVMDPLIDCSDFFIDVYIFLFLYHSRRGVAAVREGIILYIVILFNLWSMYKIIRGLLPPLHQQSNRG